MAQTHTDSVGELFLGLAKTHLQHILIATAINLVRVVAWLTDPRSQKRRAAPLAALAFVA
jgi:transposase